LKFCPQENWLLWSVLIRGCAIYIAADNVKRKNLSVIINNVCRRILYNYWLWNRLLSGFINLKKKWPMGLRLIFVFRLNHKQMLKMTMKLLIDNNKTFSWNISIIDSWIGFYLEMQTNYKNLFFIYFQICDIIQLLTLE
jgi:hypothetical protein